MKRLIIVGAGGHGQVIADAALRQQEAGGLLRPIGFVDDRSEIQSSQPLGLPVLGRVDALQSIPHDAIVIAIGDNRTRRELQDRLQRLGETIESVIHRSAVVAVGVQIGEGSMLCAGAIVNTGSRIGRGTILNTGCSIDHHNRIGDFCHIAPGSHTGGEVVIGDETLIGLGATVMPGRRIGRGVTVGAASLVNRDLPDSVTVVGVPARSLRSFAQ